jgi:Cu/Ag efflux pump CusA
MDAVYTSTAYPSYSPDQARQAAYDLEVANKRIEELQNITSALGRQINERDMKFANAKAIILEAFDGNDFDKDVVTAIAEALDIELTKEYNVTINVTFSGTITAPLGMDTDDFERQLEFTAEPNGWGDSYEMEVDLFEDGIDLNIND